MSLKLRCKNLNGEEMVFDSWDEFHNNEQPIIYLDCRHNKLTKLPELPNSLETLLCSYNNLKNLPKLPINLKVLNCKENELTELPELPDTLEILFCQYNYINSAPEIPCNLTDLNIGINSLKSFPKLKQYNEKKNFLLKNLFLLNNEISSIDQSIKEFKNLKILNIDNNNLIHLPELPDSIEILECCSNNIQKLPNLPRNLQTLDCQFNKIKKLPENLIALRNLRNLYIVGNFTELTIQQINFINRLQVIKKMRDTIYDDHQNIHDSHIQKCLYNNINNLMKK